MSITTNDVTALSSGRGNVLSTDGNKIGSIGQIYLDDSTGDPAWVTAKTGLFGTSESFVPLKGASTSGDDVVVGFDQDTVKGAPRIDDDGSLSPEEEETLYSYYGVGTTGVAQTQTSTNGDYAADGDVDTDLDRGNVHGTVGHDTSGPTTDDAMTRSEESLEVGTRTQEAGRARLRKYVVTENVTQTVPVSHEEVRIEREPITDANVGAADAGPAISEEEHEVVLHAETPVVQKTVTPVERVRLGTETVTEQQTVTDEVRKEVIDTDTDGVVDNGVVGSDDRSVTGR